MVSLEDAQKEFMELLRHSSDPAFMRLRAATQSLSGPDQEHVEQAICQFMTSDASFDAAARQHYQRMPGERGADPRLPILVHPAVDPLAPRRSGQQAQQPQPPAPDAPMEPSDDAHG